MECWTRALSKVMVTLWFWRQKAQSASVCGAAKGLPKPFSPGPFFVGAIAAALCSHFHLLYITAKTDQEKWKKIIALYPVLIIIGAGILFTCYYHAIVATATKDNNTVLTSFPDHNSIK